MYNDFMSEDSSEIVTSVLLYHCVTVRRYTPAPGLEQGVQERHRPLRRGSLHGYTEKGGCNIKLSFKNRLLLTILEGFHCVYTGSTIDINCTTDL